jgi:hypothetical protein
MKVFSKCCDYYLDLDIILLRQAMMKWTKSQNTKDMVHQYMAPTFLSPKGMTRYVKCRNASCDVRWTKVVRISFKYVKFSSKILKTPQRDLPMEKCVWKYVDKCTKGECILELQPCLPICEINNKTCLQIHGYPSTCETKGKHVDFHHHL